MRRPVQKALIVIFALVLGLIFGSIEHFPGFDQLQPEKAPNVEAIDSNSGEIADETSRSTDIIAKRDSDYLATSDIAPTTATSEDARTVVYAHNGIMIAPARDDGNFVGYLVIESGDDHRFADGDVITTINGVKTEDSAAGSELLVAALMNPYTVIELRNETE